MPLHIYCRFRSRPTRSSGMAIHSCT